MVHSKFCMRFVLTALALLVLCSRGSVSASKETRIEARKHDSNVENQTAGQSSPGVVLPAGHEEKVKQETKDESDRLASEREAQSGQGEVKSASGRKCCRVAASASTANSSTDDTEAILSALRSCNKGGLVKFDAPHYTIAQPLDVKDLEDIHIEVSGTIAFGNTVSFWQEKAIYMSDQANYSYTRIGGSKVSIFGNGTIDGKGAPFWAAFATRASSLKRPHLLGFDELTDSSVTGLTLLDSPQWFMIVQNSKRVVFDGLKIHAENGTNHAAKNTDGMNTYRSDSITFRNTNVINGDDCVAFKANSTNILIENMNCITLPGGSGGMSVGSLGQFEGRNDVVENVIVRNCKMKNPDSAMRIKSWPAEQIQSGMNLHGGGGTGLVRNVTWENISIDNATLAVEINQCYGVENKSTCPTTKSNVAIESASFIKITGMTGTKKDPFVGSLECSASKPCKGLTFRDFDVSAPKGERDVMACANIDNSTSKLENIRCAANFIEVKGNVTTQPDLSKFPKGGSGKSGGGKSGGGKDAKIASAPKTQKPPRRSSGS